MLFMRKSGSNFDFHCSDKKKRKKFSFFFFWEAKSERIKQNKKEEEKRKTLSDQHYHFGEQSLSRSTTQIQYRKTIDFI